MEAHTITRPWGTIWEHPGAVTVKTEQMEHRWPIETDFCHKNDTTRDKRNKIYIYVSPQNTQLENQTINQRYWLIDMFNRYKITSEAHWTRWNGKNTLKKNISDLPGHFRSPEYISKYWNSNYKNVMRVLILLTTKFEQHKLLDLKRLRKGTLIGSLVNT